MENVRMLASLTVRFLKLPRKKAMKI